MILLLASLLSLLYGAITNSFFSQGRVLHFFVSCLVLGVFVTFLNSFLEKYLKKLIKRHTVIEHSKVRSKEIYKPSTEVELSIRGLGTDTPISTKETFSNEKLKGRFFLPSQFYQIETSFIFSVISSYPVGISVRYSTSRSFQEHTSLLSKFGLSLNPFTSLLFTYSTSKSPPP